VLAGDISSSDCETLGYKADVLVNSSEYKVDLFVAAPPFPPSFNNSHVVSVDREVVAELWESSEGPNEKFKANGFCPSDVPLSILCLPTRD
jgi:hypothetical protein